MAEVGGEGWGLKFPEGGNNGEATKTHVIKNGRERPEVVCWPLLRVSKSSGGDGVIGNPLMVQNLTLLLLLL